MNAPLPPPNPPAFRPFIRVVVTPATWPWDQMRVARLEAMHTSPLSGGEANLVLRRLKPWTPGQPGEFAAIYLRAGDTPPAGGFDVEIQGRKLHVDLPSPAARAADLRDKAWLIGSAAVIAVALAGLTLLAMERRAGLDDRLSTLETRLDREVRKARTVAHAKRDAEALEELELAPQGVDRVLADLNRVTIGKAADARIDAFYWRKGYWAVEAHGDARPVEGPGLVVQRSAKPVRRGVWLWAGGGEETQP